MDKDLKIQENNTLNKCLFKDNTILFCFQKIQKIGTATYLITNHFASEEPLKWALRQSSINILKDIIELEIASMTDRNIFSGRILAEIKKLAYLYELAVFAGFITQINFRLIHGEISKIGEELANIFSKESPKSLLSFSESFFEVKRTTFEPEIDKRQEEHKRHNVLYNNLSSISRTPSNNSTRKQKILDFIKEKGIVSIKDISSSVKGCSEKTIQRELLSLMEEGTIIREGERRWSKYVLAKRLS